MIEFLKKLIRKETVPLVHVEGNKKVARFQWIGEVKKDPNTLLDLFSLIQWEIRSDPVQFFYRGKSLGWGYVGDIAGTTVDLDRNVTEPITIPPQEKSEPESGLSYKAIVARLQSAIPFTQMKKGPEIPVVVLIGKGKIAEIHFDYGTVVEGWICIARTNTRYLINQDTQLEITMPDGTMGAGWICDESNQTLTINRSVKVMGIARDKKGNPIMKVDGSPLEIEVGINWSGRLGKYSTNDKLTTLYASAVSGKEKLIFGALLFIVGNLIGVVLHI